MVTVGSETAALLRTYRAAAVRDKITGAHRRAGGSSEHLAVAVGSAGGAANESGVGRSGVATAGDGHDEEALFGGVRMDTMIQEGLVRGRKHSGDDATLAPCCTVVAFFDRPEVVGCVQSLGAITVCFF